jgi:hypothetical protein
LPELEEMPQVLESYACKQARLDLAADVKDMLEVVVKYFEEKLSVVIAHARDLRG